MSLESSKDDDSAFASRDNKCPICLESFVLPIQLPSCKHKFCFLCIKGVALRTGKCAMCRSPIAQSILTQPENLLANEVKIAISPKKSKHDDSSKPTCSKSGSCNSLPHTSPTFEFKESSDQVVDDVKWYYSGYKGWWEYDQRTSRELETLHQKFKNFKSHPNDSSQSDSHRNAKSKTSFAQINREDSSTVISMVSIGQFEVMISGYVYIVDFKRMIQYRQNMTGRARNIKRVQNTDDQLKPGEIKGVSGIKSEQPKVVQEKSDKSSSANDPGTSDSSGKPPKVYSQTSI